MTFVRAMPIAMLLSFAGPIFAQAQFPNPPQQAPAADCRQLQSLGEDMQKKGEAISAAVKRKAPPQEACTLIRTFAAAEIRLAKVAEDSGVWCGVTPQVVQQLKQSQARTAKIQANACAAAAAPPRPAGPTLGEALGTTRVPDATTTRTGRGGAFDTMTGNPITR